MPNFDIITVARGKNDPPFNPYVYVVLSEHFKDPNGNITLSAKLMSEIEIDESVNLLINKLEKAREKAKRKLKKAKEQNLLFTN
jgi:hypothetical protein